MKQVRGKLTYANVMATVAVFIALGGAAYAAVKLPKNSVGTKQIKNNAITGSKIKNGAVTAAKIAPGAIPQTAVNPATLGTVPSATNSAHATNADNAVHATTADNAATLQGQTVAQLTAGAKPKCPAGTIAAAGVCFESSARPVNYFFAALEACGASNMSMPTLGQLYTFLLRTTPIGEDDWAGSYFVSGGQFEAPLLSVNFKGGIAEGNSLTTNTAQFRCVTTPTS